MCDKSEEYIKGYEQGVKDLAEKIKRYYNHLSGATYCALVSFHVEQIANEMTVQCEKV